MTAEEFNQLKKGDTIRYANDSFAFEGDYNIISIEETYLNPEDCPEKDRGKLLIIELMNDGTPMFFFLDLLNHEDWEKV